MWRFFECTDYKLQVFRIIRGFFPATTKSFNLDLSDFDPKVYPVTGIVIP